MASSLEESDPDERKEIDQPNLDSDPIESLESKPVAVDNFQQRPFELFIVDGCFFINI
jgi:hypothetical protein